MSELDFDIAVAVLAPLVFWFYAAILADILTGIVWMGQDLCAFARDVWRWENE